MASDAGDLSAKAPDCPIANLGQGGYPQSRLNALKTESLARRQGELGQCLTPAPLTTAFVSRFSGHTQVNATDLRQLAHPDHKCLQAMSGEIQELDWPQDKIDELVEKYLYAQAWKSTPITLCHKSSN